MTRIKLIQRARLASIDFYLYYIGHISRKEHSERFGLEGAQAARDIILYQELAASNHIVYDAQKKLYLATDSFKPLYKHPSKDAVKRIILALETEEILQVASALLGTPLYSLLESKS